ncbi:uncharacterized protein [Hemitrygon akajei]|uniref:uncharacterized protein n=1 Tax=Hemitrygon akajei TaxID=2704970 RepID=UPI003BF994CE
MGSLIHGHSLLSMSYCLAYHADSSNVTSMVDREQQRASRIPWWNGVGGRERRARKEDICAVILLVSTRDVAEEMKRTDPESFPEGTEVMSVTNPESQSVKSEDICAVIFLERGLDKWNKPVEFAHQGVFDDNTVVVRINSIQEGPNNGEAKERIKQSIMDCQKKQRVKKDNWIVILSEKSLDNLYKPVEVAHQGMFDANTVIVRILCNSPDEIQEVPSNVEAMNKVKQSIRRCHGSSEDPQGSEFPSLYSTSTSMCSEQPDHSTSSTCTQEKSEKSSEKLRCNGDRTVRKEDVCSVILLQKSGDFRVNKMTTDPGLFHEGANVFQIFWTEASVTWTSTDEGHAVIQTVRQSLVNKTESRGVSCPGSPAGGGR